MSTLSMRKNCPVCARPLGDRVRWGGVRYCWTCFRVASPLISRARQLVTKAIASGQLPPATRLYCVDCGGFAFGYDHRDYTQPLAVVPICRSCNHKRGQAYPLTPGAIEHFDPTARATA